MKSEILNSATKLVLLYLIFILGTISLFAGIWDIVHAQFSEVTKIILALFGSVVNFVAGYYFSEREKSPVPIGTVTTSKTNTEVTTVKDTPTAG